MRMTPVTPKKSAIKAPCHDAGKFTRTGSASHRGTKSKATPRTIKKSNPYLLRSSFRKSGDKWGQSPIIASRITKRDSDPTYQHHLPASLRKSQIRLPSGVDVSLQKTGTSPFNPSFTITVTELYGSNEEMFSCEPSSSFRRLICLTQNCRR